MTGEELRISILQRYRPGRAVALLSSEEYEVFRREAYRWRECIRPATRLAALRQGILAYFRSNPDDPKTEFHVIYRHENPVLSEDEQRMLRAIGKVLDK